MCLNWALFSRKPVILMDNITSYNVKTMVMNYYSFLGNYGYFQVWDPSKNMSGSRKTSICLFYQNLELKANIIYMENIGNGSFCDWI